MKLRKRYQVKNKKKDNDHIKQTNKVKKRLPSLSTFTTIRIKLILSFLVPIAFIIFLGVVSYNKSAEGMRNSYEHSTKQAVNMTGEYLQFGMSGIDALSTQYQNDDNIKNYFMGTYKNDVVKNSNNYKFILNSIIAKEATDDFISEVSILSDKVKSITTASIEENNICTEFYQTEIGEAVHKSNKIVWVGTNSYLDEKLGIKPKEYSFRLLRNVMGTDAMIVIDIDDNTVRSIIKKIEFDKGTIGIITADGKEIISGSEPDDKKSIFIGQAFYKKATNSDKANDAYYVDFKGESHLFLYSKIGNTGAMICAVVPESTILNQARSIRTITIIIVFIACIIAILTGLIISLGIDNTIRYIITKLKKVAEGDLTIQLSTKRHDEFKILIQELNYTFSNMNELVGQVKDLTTGVSETSVNVATTSEEFVKTTGEISTAMKGIELGIAQQAKDAEECLQQMDNLSNKLTRMNENTKNIEAITEGTRQSIKEGTIATSNLNEQTISTKEITSIIVKEIENLAEKSKSIDSIINVINGISNQTNLLSLNASIEAARAGEVGKGFAVVAGEIRSLSEQTRNSVNDIKNIIMSIQQNTDNVVLTANKAVGIIELQDSAVRNTTDSYQCINENVDNLMIHLKSITDNVNNVEEARISTLAAIENISAVLEEIAASTDDISQTSMNQSLSVDTLNHWANYLKGNSEHLVSAIQKFNV